MGRLIVGSAFRVVIALVLAWNRGWATVRGYGLGQSENFWQMERRHLIHSLSHLVGDVNKFSIAKTGEHKYNS